MPLGSVPADLDAVHVLRDGGDAPVGASLGLTTEFSTQCSPKLKVHARQGDKLQFIDTSRSLLSVSLTPTRTGGNVGHQ